MSAKYFAGLYEVSVTKQRKNEEKRLNYAYFDAQSRENTLKTQLNCNWVTFFFVFVLLALSSYDLRFSRKRRTSLRIKNLPERGCPEKHENRPKMTDYS